MDSDEKELNSAIKYLYLEVRDELPDKRFLKGLTYEGKIKLLADLLLCYNAIRVQGGLEPYYLEDLNITGN